MSGNWDLDPTGAGQQGTLNWVTEISGVRDALPPGNGGHGQRALRRQRGLHGDAWWAERLR